MQKLRITFLAENILGRFFAAEILFGFKSVIVNSDLCMVVPLLVYSNADVDKVSIVKNNKGKAGVYC